MREGVGIASVASLNLSKTAKNRRWDVAFGGEFAIRFPRSSAKTLQDWRQPL